MIMSRSICCNPNPILLILSSVSDAMPYCTSNSPLWIVASKTHIRSPVSTAMHPQRRLVHAIVVHNLAIQHRRTGLPFPENRRRIAPKIAAIRDNPTGKRVLLPCRAALRSRKKCIKSQELLPLFEAAVASMRMRRRGRCRIRAMSGRCEASRVKRRSPSCQRRGDGLRVWMGMLNRMASHVLISRLVA